MKRLISGLLVLIMVLTLVACGNGNSDNSTSDASTSETASASSEETASSEDSGTDVGDVANDPKVTLTYAEVNPETSLMGMTAQTFKETVEELSGGSITVNLQAGGVLGAEGDVLDAMTSNSGTIDISRISVVSLNDFDGINVSKLVSVPYIFTDREHYWNTVDSYIGEEILEECHDAGLNIRGIAFVEEGFRHFFFTKEVSSIDDVAGLKIRSQTDSTSTSVVEALGASPSTIAFNELYTSLSSGVVEGADQPIANYQSNYFNEVAPYMILDGHTMGAAMLIISDDTWDKLTEAQQKVVQQAAQAASDYNRENSEIIENECIEELEASGVTFVEVNDKTPWREACADVIASVTEGLEEYTEYIESLDK